MIAQNSVLLMFSCALHPLVCKLWSCERQDCDLVVNTNLSSSAAFMEASSRVMQVLLLALVVQVALSQHWSYGWLPGGKRSVGELEATIRVSYFDLFLRGWFNSFRECSIIMKYKTKCEKNASINMSVKHDSGFFEIVYWCFNFYFEFSSSLKSFSHCA